MSELPPLEELRRSRDEMETVSHSLSHDLRTPLRAIDGFGELLLEEYGDRLDDAGRGYLERVRHASQHMGRLLDDFVQFLRIARAKLVRESVDLGATARTIADGLARAEPERRVEWRIDAGLVALGDSRLLTLALAALIENAWKFTQARPVATIALSARREHGHLVATVEDNGIGFEMAYVDKLFEPFERLAAHQEHTEGTGMSLAIVKLIIERHGGRIWAEGRPGEGARFTFTLPLAVGAGGIPESG